MRAAGAPTYPSGHHFGYDYDPAGLLTGIRDVDAAAQLFSFSYDARHRINIRTDVGAGTVDHAFDRLDRLSSLAHTFTGGTGDVTFGFTSYNPASQLETRTRSRRLCLERPRRRARLSVERAAHRLGLDRSNVSTART
ncbi:MAG TPA: hypothetical protein VF704_11890 [Allosphingosinicella sp.]|jgi:YD repeat-containing protein